MIDYITYGFNVALLLGLIIALTCRSLGVLGLCAVFALVVVVLGAFSLGLKNQHNKAKPSSTSLSASNLQAQLDPSKKLPASMSGEAIGWAPFRGQPSAQGRQYSTFAHPELEMTAADKAADHIRAYNAQRATQFSSQQPFFVQETQGETRPDAYMTRRPVGPNMYDPRDPRDFMTYDQQARTQQVQQYQQVQTTQPYPTQQVHRSAAITSSQDPMALDNPMNSLSYLSGR
jgi:hypothetical protein